MTLPIADLLVREACGASIGKLAFDNRQWV